MLMDESDEALSIPADVQKQLLMDEENEAQPTHDVQSNYCWRNETKEVLSKIQDNVENNLMHETNEGLYVLEAMFNSVIILS